MANSTVFNMDCMEALKEFPDKYFSLCVADPPYGLNITGRNRKNGGGYKSEAVNPSEARATVYGNSAKALSKATFILCSTTAPRRTLKYLGSYSELVTS